jgi:selenocysteine lyase/cysteine desulfurase
LLKAHYRRFLAANPDRLHFAAHSHHLWPDVTRDAVLAAWDAAARLVDRKWDHVLGDVLPKAQAHVARILDLSHPAQIAFAPNTHELVMRIVSCFDAAKPLRMLTTDGEFMSFARQAARLEEEPGVRVTRVPAEPFPTFAARFRAAAAAGGHDFVYFSQVFFNSGFALRDLAGIVSAVPDPDTLVVIDGYHAFCAVPTSLRSIEERAFYLAGGYKYAQSGEGVCFLHVPEGTRLRPVDTGWFATFGRLSAAPATESKVEYAEDGFRFWGATFDPTGLYRLNAVMDWLQQEGVTVERIHEHVRALQERLLSGLETGPASALPASALVTPRSLDDQGHFLTFRRDDASGLAGRLAERGVDVDVRGDRIRFGFGLYHDAADVDSLIERLRSV